MPRFSVMSLATLCALLAPRCPLPRSAATGTALPPMPTAPRRPCPRTACSSMRAALARMLLQRAQSPQLPGKLEGRWKVRSIQVGQHFTYASPYFKARIARDPCGYRLSKTGGTLSPLAKDRREFAFLGTSTVNDNPQGHYAPGNVSDGTNGNSVGRLVALGPDELLLILDSNDKSFELYQLIC